MTEILLTSGYTDIADVHDGDQCVAYDISGNRVTNTIENIDEWRNVDGQIWAWTKDTGAEIGPQGGEWKWLLVNGWATLFVAQSIWRMPAGGGSINVCHASDLEVGDTYYDGSDNAVVIASIADTTGPDVWYRFDVSGDHGYIADDVSLHNASRFAVNAGAVDWPWDLSATTHWASSSGGSSGASAPGSADAVTFDGNSGGHVVTVGFGGTGAFQSLTWGAFTGTIDNSVNNNNFTLTSSSAYSGSGTGARSFKAGSATYTLSSTAAAATLWTISTTTNLTFDAGTSIIDYTGVVAAGNGQTFAGGALTYATLRVSGARFNSGLNITGANIFALLTNTATALVNIGSSTTVTTLTPAAQLTLVIGTGATLTLTNAPTFTGSASAPNAILNSSVSATSSTATISCPSGTCSGTYCDIQGCTFSGGATFTFTNSSDLGKNTGATITPPAAGGGSGNSGGYIIGS